MFWKPAYFALLFDTFLATFGPFPPLFSLSATARPHNSALRSKSFTLLRHFVCAVERPVAENVISRGNILFKTSVRTRRTPILTTHAQRLCRAATRPLPKLECRHSRCYAPEMYLTRHPLNSGLKCLRCRHPCLQCLLGQTRGLSNSRRHCRQTCRQGRGPVYDAFSALLGE